MPIVQRLCCLICLFALTVSTAQGSIDNLTIEGDEASADVTLPGGIAAQLKLRFDSAVGLSAGSLGLSVEAVDPASPGLLTRLPSLTDLSLPSNFPLLLTIAAPADGGLAFEGIVEIELYTRSLSYTTGTTLRLFSSSNGEDFRDITDAVSGGSYRVRGSSGQFSQFLILADDRPLPDIIETKFSRLSTLLSAHAGAIDPAVANNLNLLAGTAHTHWQAGNPGAAIDQVRQLDDAVESAADAGLLPDVWQSSREVDNVAGLLRATARTLGFSLGLAQAGTP